MYRRLAIVVCLSAIVGLAGVPSASASVLVKGSGTRWSPAKVTVAKGGLVRWKATLGTHHVRAYGGNWSFSRALPSGSSVTRRFRHKGTFRFYCTIHGALVNGVCTGMCGKIVVR
jgi:plastocyanin